MTGSMGRTSLAEGLPRAQRVEKDPRDGAPGHHPLRSSKISGATSSSSMSTSAGRRRRGRTRARHLRCGRLSGRSRRRGGKAALGADPVQAEGQGRQGEVPQLPLSSMVGPLGFQESQRGGVLQRSSPPQQVLGIVRPFPQGWVGV